MENLTCLLIDLPTRYSIEEVENVCEAVWFGMAGGEKPLKWLPVFAARS
jgi:hypothetical protein